MCQAVVGPRTVFLSRPVYTTPRIAQCRGAFGAFGTHMPRPQRHAQSEKTTPEHATFFSAPQCEPHADRMPIALMALPGNAWPGQGDPGRVRTARSRTYSYAACAAVLGAPKRRKVAKPAHREPRPEGAQEVISRGLHGDMWAGRGHQGRLRTAISRRYAYAKGARAYRALLKASFVTAPADGGNPRRRCCCWRGAGGDDGGRAGGARPHREPGRRARRPGERRARR